MMKIQAITYMLLAAALVANGTAVPLADDNSAEAYSQEIRKQLDNPRVQTTRNSRSTDPGMQ